MMIDQGIAAAKLLIAVVFNAVGLLALLAGAWFMLQLLQLVVGLGRAVG